MRVSASDRVFAFIRDGIEATGYSPNLAEIAAEFGFSSARASKLVTFLVEGGRLSRRGVGTHDLRIPGRVDLAHVGTETLRAELARRERSPESMVA